ncbi:hypothetical protein G7Y79_00026g059660 [Physcia stellaris]|nr:hypothetical protein G7Y79_00026g059660 [Physcia stellaris]
MATYDFSLVDSNLVAFAEYMSTEAQRFTGCETVGLHLLQQHLNQNPDLGSYPPHTFKGVASTRLAEPETQLPVYSVEESLAEFSVFVSEAAAAFTGYPLVGQHLLTKYYNLTSDYPEIGNSMSTAVDAPSRSDNGSGLARVSSRNDAGSEDSGLAVHSAMDTSEPAVAANQVPVFSTHDQPGFHWIQQQNTIPHSPRQPSHRGASRQGFHGLTTRQIWKVGDILHVPVMSYHHSGVKIPSFFKNVPDATMSVNMPELFIKYRT